MKNFVLLVSLLVLALLTLAEDEDAAKETPEAKTWVTEQSARVVSPITC